jgi:hypothetical protein
MEQTSLEMLAARLAAVEERLATAEQARQGTERRLRWWKGAAGLLFLCGLLLGYPQLSQAQGGTVEERLAVVEGKLSRVIVLNNGADIILNGANLYLVNGAGNTQSANGLGNLVIGYNEARGGGLDLRTGSHNLILGQQNNYTSFGGFIGGFANQVSAPFAAVLTGNGNAATEFYALVGTGRFNNAASTFAAVYAGENNTAAGLFSSVTGGERNTASGEWSAVTGGERNTASGEGSAVSGGEHNTASGNQSSVSGGVDNTANGLESSVSGGVENIASGVQSSVSGGEDNEAGAFASSVSGGFQEVIGNLAADEHDWRAGGMLFPDM